MQLCYPLSTNTASGVAWSSPGVLASVSQLLCVVHPAGCLIGVSGLQHFRPCRRVQECWCLYVAHAITMLLQEACPRVCQQQGGWCVCLSLRVVLFVKESRSSVCVVVVLEARSDDMSVFACCDLRHSAAAAAQSCLTSCQGTAKVGHLPLLS